MYIIYIMQYICSTYALEVAVVVVISHDSLQFRWMFEMTMSLQTLHRLIEFSQLAS